MEVEGELLPVKMDNGARYSVAGTDWMPRGGRVRGPVPVDVVEGIGAFVLNVIGVWTSHMRNTFGQWVKIEACIIDVCTDEFLVGVDFLQRHKAVVDFEKNEVRYCKRQQHIINPFRTDEGCKCANVAVVRLARRARLSHSAVTPIAVAVAAPDGVEGVGNASCSNQGVTFTAVPPCADDDEDQGRSQADDNNGHTVDSGSGRQDYSSEDDSEDGCEDGCEDECEDSSATEMDDDDQDPSMEDNSGELWQPRMAC
ncbi:unnamed protein product [Phytophthora fragariaefolia]|uniref:Unnamed protein product n=1 Tax=Phytophthora fragariaefolia TaxID=1490495 RepID=A0A9W6X0E5_9STRA|nr:unnamed protein product [Phytophthora fragariaefolia]